MDGVGAQNAAYATLPREGVPVGSMDVLEETSYPPVRLKSLFV